MGMLWEGLDIYFCPLENISVCLVTHIKILVPFFLRFGLRIIIAWIQVSHQIIIHINQFKFVPIMGVPAATI